jgi:hypothetical protein
MKRIVRKYLKKTSPGRRLFRARRLLEADSKAPQAYLPGHFYSPIQNLEKLKTYKRRHNHRTRKGVPDIDLNEDEQLGILKEFRKYYSEIPFELNKKEGLRFYYDREQPGQGLKNTMFSYSDAIFLYCMIRYAKPKNIIEVGSGFSSCVILDCNDLFFEGSINCNFIEPFPDRLFSLLEDNDINQINLIKKDIEDIDLSFFDSLSANDIIFFDSTHVSKFGSDVNYIFFEILPSLNSGVYIHFSPSISSV